jgi:hypothetical protein
MRIVVRGVQAAVIAMLVVVTISVVRGVGGGAAEPNFDNGVSTPEGIRAGASVDEVAAARRHPPAARRRRV